jgi:hypothetical protein
VRLQPRHASLIGGAPGSSSGSLAKFAAMRRASSLLSSLAAERRPGLVFEVEVRKRLPDVVADDEAGVVLLVDPPRW